MNRFLLSIALSSLLFAQEVTLEKVLIQEELEEISPTLQQEELEFTRQQDLAEMLSELLPEINIVRASAIGNDIVLRGFKRDDINVLIDGAKIYGACPNRMDPPAMHVSAGEIESIVVKEGPFDVENFGSLGGVVEVKTKEPKEGKESSIGVRVGSFGFKKGEFTTSGGDERFKFLLGASRESSEQYEDGDGRTLVEQNWYQLGKKDPYSYQEKYKDLDAYHRGVVWGKTVFTPTSNQELKLSFYSDKATDVLYPAFQMDAQLDKTLMVNGEYLFKELAPYSKELSFSGYYSSVKHDMGTEFRNAALPQVMDGKLYRTHHVESYIKGGKVKNSFDAADILWTVGADVSKRNWNGICLSEPSKKPRQVRIPDVDTDNGGIFLKALKNLDRLTLKFGVRYDKTDIEANNLNDPTIANVPAIQNHYKNKTSRDFKNLSANLVADYRVNDDISVYFGVGQGVRVPDAQELYFIGYMKGNWTRKGNPDLKESKNQEVDLGVSANLGELSLHAGAFYSKLKDYIYAYRSNVGNADPNSYYLTWTNIDAHIYGGDLGANYSLNDYLFLEGSLAYQRGEKDDLIPNQKDKDMAMIPPLHARVALSYSDGDDFAMIEGLFSSDWEDFDSDNGERAIDGWSVINLKASKRINDEVTLNVGVDNVFDETYATNNTYVGRALIGARTPVLINEPGRFWYANLNVRF